MILSFADAYRAREINQIASEESYLTDIGQQIIDNIITTPASLSLRLDQSSRSVVTVKQWEVAEVVICASIAELKQQGVSEITPSDALAVQYFGQFIEEFVSWVLSAARAQIIENSYVIDFVQKEDFQTAWDAAVYSLFFKKHKRNNQLTSKDYLHFASQCYFRWYGQKPTSIGHLLSEGVSQLLPIMDGILERSFPKVAQRYLVRV